MQKPEENKPVVTNGNVSATYTKVRCAPFLSDRYSSWHTANVLIENCVFGNGH
eukprot:COSAG02_NODE_45194_length_359_cov_0.984615_1_plen_52_part_01